MSIISISRNLTVNEFEKLNRIWDANKNVSILLPEEFSDVEVEQIFKLLLSRLPNEFAFCVLENVAEQQKVSVNLLRELFDHGDTGCCVTICLRDDLTGDLVERCMSSNNNEVREHFLRKSNRENQ